MMKPRERIQAALDHREPDRVPRFEVWIDGLLDELGDGDPATVYVHTGQDGILIPTQRPPTSRAWRDGVDEWGRVWDHGMYVEGAVDTRSDLRRYTPPLSYVDQMFDPARIGALREGYPDHYFFFGSHVGPFTEGYMAMGFERFFLRMRDDPAFIHQLLEARTEWCIALFRKGIDVGAELLVLGDDAAHREAPMISPQAWREFVLPYHKRIVAALSVPVIWHSDGDIVPLLPMAIEAGFAGIHGLEPAAGIDLARVKREFGRDLVLTGNVDVGVLFGTDFDAIHREVDRCLTQGAPGGGYMLSTCNSIFTGMEPAAVKEMFRYQRELAAAAP